MIDESRMRFLVDILVDITDLTSGQAVFLVENNPEYFDDIVNELTDAYARIKLSKRLCERLGVE